MCFLGYYLVCNIAILCVILSNTERPPSYVLMYVSQSLDKVAQAQGIQP